MDEIRRGAHAIAKSMNDGDSEPYPARRTAFAEACCNPSIVTSTFTNNTAGVVPASWEFSLPDAIQDIKALRITTVNHFNNTGILPAGTTVLILSNAICAKARSQCGIYTVNNAGGPMGGVATYANIAACFQVVPSSLVTLVLGLDDKQPKFNFQNESDSWSRAYNVIPKFDFTITDGLGNVIQLPPNQYFNVTMHVYK